MGNDISRDDDFVHKTSENDDRVEYEVHIINDIVINKIKLQQADYLTENEKLLMNFAQEKAQCELNDTMSNCVLKIHVHKRIIKIKAGRYDNEIVVGIISGRATWTFATRSLRQHIYDTGRTFKNWFAGGNENSADLNQKPDGNSNQGV